MDINGVGLKLLHSTGNRLVKFMFGVSCNVDGTGFVFQRESTRLLSWLKALKETHGSVEQSSLSLASSINTHGVYHVGWSSEKTEKVKGQS